MDLNQVALDEILKRQEYIIVALNEIKKKLDNFND